MFELVVNTFWCAWTLLNYSCERIRDRDNEETNSKTKPREILQHTPPHKCAHTHLFASLRNSDQMCPRALLRLVAQLR
jgi:hypothetical protein